MFCFIIPDKIAVSYVHPPTWIQPLFHSLPAFEFQFPPITLYSLLSTRNSQRYVTYVTLRYVTSSALHQPTDRPTPTDTNRHRPTPPNKTVSNTRKMLPFQFLYYFTSLFHFMQSYYTIHLHTLTLFIFYNMLYVFFHFSVYYYVILKFRIYFYLYISNKSNDLI